MTALTAALAARNREFKRRYLAGETLQAIGDDYGVSRERVRQVLRKMGVESLGHRPEHCQQAHELTANEIAAANAYADGERPMAIIERYGLAHQQLLAACRRLGVKVRNPGDWNRRPDDAELTARVCALYRDGKAAREIVALVPELKFRETVYRYLARGGVKPRNDMRKGIVERNRGTVMALRNAGCTYAEIAENIGVTASAIWYFFNRHKHTLRHAAAPAATRPADGRPPRSQRRLPGDSFIHTGE